MEGFKRGAGLLLGAMLSAGVVDCVLTPPAASGQSIAYVHGSRVSVRSQPSIVAPIADYVTTNTAVDMQDRTGEWCRIRSSFTASRSGFVQCQVLGDLPLAPEMIRAQVWRTNASRTFPSRELLEYTSRRFWADPTLTWFEQVGLEITSSVLSERERAREEASRELRRVPYPDFEAMKVRLAAGIVPARIDHRPRNVFIESPLFEALERHRLPAVRSSFFRGDEPLFVVALRPLTLVEQSALALSLADALAAVHGIPLRAKDFKAAEYGYYGPTGAWDVSSVDVAFDKPVTLNGVTARGELTGLSITSIVAPIGEQMCSQGLMKYTAKPSNARWNAAIVGWVGKRAPGTATVSIQAFGKEKYERVTLQDIDLNGDRIADFLVWSGVEPPERSPSGQMDWHWKAVFANVDGRWTIVAFGRSHDCT